MRTKFLVPFIAAAGLASAGSALAGATRAVVVDRGQQQAGFGEAEGLRHQRALGVECMGRGRRQASRQPRECGRKGA